MQETPLFTIRYHKTEDLVFDYTKLLPVYKKRLKMYRGLFWFSLILIVTNIVLGSIGRDVDWGMQIFLLFIALYVFSFPSIVKMRVRNQFKNDSSNKNAVLMMVYEDRIEFADEFSESSLKYEGIDCIVETTIGVHLFLSEVKALSIPREAVPEQALEFLKKRIK
jgi:hypothetical protein